MLLDVSVCFALVWSRQPQHDAAMAWFDRAVQSEQKQSLCRVSQMGLLRLVTNHKVMGADVLTQRAAWNIYEQLAAQPTIEYRNEPSDVEVFFQRISSRNEASTKRWTDDYLTAFAEASKLQLITLDKRLARNSPSVVLLS